MKICKECVHFIKVKFQITFKKLEEYEFKCAEGVTGLSNEKIIIDCNQLKSKQEPTKSFGETLKEYSKNKKCCPDCGVECEYISGAIDYCYCNKCELSFKII